MWCSDCKEDFATVAESVIQVCPKCRLAESSGARNARKRRVPKLVQSPRVAIADTHTNTSKACDISGHIRFESVSRPSQPSPDQTLQKTVECATGAPRQSSTSLGRRPAVHLVGFGLFVFLVGQALQIWAFLQELLLVWSLANLVSIAGITVAFTGALVSLRGFDRRLRDFGTTCWAGRDYSRPPAQNASRKVVR